MLVDSKETVSRLMTLCKQLLQLDDIIKKYSNYTYENSTIFRRNGKLAANNKLSFVRVSYYTLPRNNLSRSPLFAFLLVPSPCVSEEGTNPQKEYTIIEPAEFLDGPNQPIGKRKYSNTFAKNK